LTFALRHTYAIRLLEKGENLKVLQELLGHSEISMTADTYSHVSPELKRDAVSKLTGSLMPKKNSSL
jgi:integrase